MEVKPEDRMNNEEIRFKYNHGVSIGVLAQLNACSEGTIKSIVAGNDVRWSHPKHTAKGNHRCLSIVVNATEGRFYPSVRVAEKREGFSQSFLQKRFKRDGPRTIVGNQEFHLYKRKKVEP